MTQDELIKCGCWFTDAGTLVTDDIDLEAFAKLVAEKEREACATMSDWILKEGGGTWGDAIRKRK
jgi:hypothetical protein